MITEYAATWAALLGAVAYGTGDFIGGCVARRLGTFRAVAIAQVVAVAFLLHDYALEQRLLPAGTLGWLSVAAGISYAIGVLAIYEGIGRGRVAIVAAICALVSILIPLAGDFVLGRMVTHHQLLGVALCAAAAVLIVAACTDCGGRGSIGRSVQLGIIGGFGFGISDLSLGTMPPDLASGALLMTRSTTAMFAVLLALCFASRASSRFHAFGDPASADSRILPATLVAHEGLSQRSISASSGLVACIGLAAIAGLFDTLGHFGYVYAATRGSMGVAAALVAMFPAMTVLLAALILRERITRPQLAGFGLGAAGIAFISP